jgi:hypothetical protein
LLLLALPCAAEPAPDRVCHFTHREPQVGDRATQEVCFEMNLLVSLRQHHQTVHTTDHGIHRRQCRTVDALEVERGCVTRAAVSFAVCEESVAETGRPRTRVEQPVVGKSYLVRRIGQGPLQVTDLEGRHAPAEEHAVVARAMDAIGRRNPLARFFDQRRISVGQTVAVPIELANELLGCPEALGAVARFEMTLEGFRADDRTVYAVFDTAIEAASPLGDGRRLDLRGKFLLEPETCRIAAIELACPVELTETRGPEGGRFELHGKGTLQVSMRSQPLPTP